MKVIYIDVLLLVNFLVNYFLVLGTCFFTKETIRRKRFLLGAFVGALFSLTILIPIDSLLLNLIIKLSGCFAISILSFGYKSPKQYLRNTVGLFLSSAAFAGLMAAAGIGNKSFFVKNMNFYIPLNPISLIVLSIIIYLVLWTYERLFKKPGLIEKKIECTITKKNKTINVSLLPDSGKKLKDMMTGAEVIVLKNKYASLILDETGNNALALSLNGELNASLLAKCGSFALIPYDTISSNGIMIAFKTDSCIIKTKNKNTNIGKTYIGFVKDDQLKNCDGIIGADILED